MPFDDTALFGGALPDDLVYRPPTDDAATRDLIFRPGIDNAQVMPAADAAPPRIPVPRGQSVTGYANFLPRLQNADSTLGMPRPDLPPGRPEPVGDLAGRPASVSGYAGFLQRLLGTEANNPDQNLMTRGSLGAGLSSVAQNWNKPAMAAFAGGAGASIAGGEKTMLALINEAIRARQLGDMAAYRKAYLSIIDQAKNRTPFELQRARAFTRSVTGQPGTGQPIHRGRRKRARPVLHQVLRAARSAARAIPTRRRPWTTSPRSRSAITSAIPPMAACCRR
jgi:hypothetical protein